MDFFDIYSFTGSVPFDNLDRTIERIDFITKLWKCRRGTEEHDQAEKALSFIDGTMPFFKTDKEKYDRSLDDYIHRNIEMDPLEECRGMDSVVLWKRASTTFANDTPAEALCYLKSLMVNYPTQQVFLMAAECYYSLNDPVLAIRAYEKAETWANSKAISVRKGDIWFDCGCYSRALREYAFARETKAGRKMQKTRRYLGLYGHDVSLPDSTSHEKAECEIGEIIITDAMNDPEQSGYPGWVRDRIEKWKHEKICSNMVDMFGILTEKDGPERGDF